MQAFYKSPILAFLILCSAIATAQESGPVKNIILFIGDGAGVGHISTLVLANPEAALFEFPTAGFSMTQSESNFVTESAAGGTALSTGYRTTNSLVAMRADGSRVQTLLEFAREHGKAVGVVATSSVTHATPAAFLAHVPSRKLEFEIAAQMATSGADVLIGGGKKWFLPAGNGGQRADGKDLLEAMRIAGYTVSTDLDAETSEARRLIWLTADDEMPAAPERRPRSAVMMQKALDVLKHNDNGFVLMVEGSRIDWAAHDNDFATLKAELLDFDETIRGALDFAKEDGSTLVVVTADHETGGLALVGRNPDGSDMQAAWTSEDHTGVMAPLFAFGPGSARFGGIHRNDEIGRMLFQLIAPKNF